MLWGLKLVLFIPILILVKFPSKNFLPYLYKSKIHAKIINSVKSPIRYENREKRW